MAGPEDYSASSDAELARTCAIRPPVMDAWNVLYGRFRSLVDARIRRMSSRITDAEAEELRQQTFLRVFTTIKDYDASRGSLSTLIARITASVVIDKWRHDKRELASTSHLEDQPLSPSEEALEEAARIEFLARAAAESFDDPDHRRISHLLLDGENGLAIAAQTGIKAHIVYTVRGKLEQKIRTAFRESGAPGRSG